jgi:hypothetical protein
MSSNPTGTVTREITTSRTTTFRRRAGAATVLLAPIALITSELSYPVGDEADPAASLGIFAAHHGALLTAIYAMLLASILFIPAFFALMTPVRGRGTVLTHLGAGMALVGLATSKLALLGVQYTFYEASAPGVDRPALTHFLQQATSDPAALPLVLGHFLFGIGLILLAAGLLRARVGYPWASACIGLGPVVEILLSSVGIEAGTIVTVVVYGLVAVGGAGLAWWMLTTSNAAWEGAAVRPAGTVAAYDVAAADR